MASSAGTSSAQVLCTGIHKNIIYSLAQINRSDFKQVVSLSQAAMFNVLSSCIHPNGKWIIDNVRGRGTSCERINVVEKLMFYNWPENVIQMGSTTGNKKFPVFFSPFDTKWLMSEKNRLQRVKLKLTSLSLRILVTGIKREMSFWPTRNRILCRFQIIIFCVCPSISVRLRIPSDYQRTANERCVHFTWLILFIICMEMYLFIFISVARLAKQKKNTKLRIFILYSSFTRIECDKWSTAAASARKHVAATC